MTRRDPFYYISREPAVIAAKMKGKRPERPDPEMSLARFTDAWWRVCCSCWEDPDTRPSIRVTLGTLIPVDVVLPSGPSSTDVIEPPAYHNISPVTRATNNEQNIPSSRTDDLAVTHRTKSENGRAVNLLSLGTLTF